MDNQGLKHRTVNYEYCVIDFFLNFHDNISMVFISWTISGKCIELHYWIIELKYLFIEMLIKIKLLEFVYWNIGWNQIKFK